MTEQFPPWLQHGLQIMLPIGRVLLIVLLAWLLRSTLRRLIQRLGTPYGIPDELLIGAQRGTAFVIYGAAFLMILERLGVSGTVLWTAFTGFAAVAAVAFFAAWSVLSNIFCALLIFTTRPFRLHEHIELLENGEKPGIKGKVIDIRLVYTTLSDTSEGHRGAVLQVPNSLFFQRTVRRWRGGKLPPPPTPRPVASAATNDGEAAAVSPAGPGSPGGDPRQ